MCASVKQGLVENNNLFFSTDILFASKYYEEEITVI